MIFAISGVITALDKKFDVVGTLVVGFVTAIGGGTIRDVLIGRLPVGWMVNVEYIYAILVGYILAYLFKKYIIKWKKSMFLFDTIGIALFTIIGINIALTYELSYPVCLIMGVVSACFGGVVRDVLTNEIPLIFRQEIYATACLIGGVFYILLTKICLYENLNILASFCVVFIIRYFSIKYRWSLNLSNKV
jgi:uncharacterized membrane protein YeiH